MVCDIPAGDGKTANLFLQCRNREVVIPARQATYAGGNDFLESILVRHKSLKIRDLILRNFKIESFFKLIRTEPGNDNLEPFSETIYEPSPWALSFRK